MLSLARPDDHHPDRPHCLSLIRRGLEEDIGRGDLTSRVYVDAEAEMAATIHAREPLVACGLELVRLTCLEVDETIDVMGYGSDGQRFDTGERMVRLSGNTRAILAAERTALNLLAYLSGIATYTAHCVELVADTGVTILDTRKTLPGYRDLSKYAVRCGGGRNHRMRLDDGVMVKDNHLATSGNMESALARARRLTPALTRIEVECDTLAQVRDALASGADMIMLDNMNPEQVAEAVKLANGRATLEASGGMTLERLQDYAKTGVDYISMGSLTHSVRAVDVGLDWTSGLGT